MASAPLFSWVYAVFRFFGRPGPVLAPFGLDLGGSWGSIFRFFGRPGPVLAPFELDLGGSGARFWMVFGFDFGRCWALFWKVFGVDFGKCWGRFWKFLVTILAYDYSWKIYGSSWKTWSFDPFCWRLVLDGLVGLREALRIIYVCIYMFYI